jgi:hypothetical protein
VLWKGRLPHKATSKASSFGCYSAATNGRPLRPLGLAQLGALHKHLHRLRLESGAAPLLLRARSLLLNFYLRLLTFCSVELSPVSGPCSLLDSHALSHVWRFSRILSILRDCLQDVPKPGPFTKIAYPGSIWSFIHGTVGLTMGSALQHGALCAESLYFLLSQSPTGPPIFLRLP